MLLEAASLVPDIPVIIASQSPAPNSLPQNIRWQSRVSDNRRLYDEGDVCVQPSHWEGIGLQLLEAQASGLPLITTDASPMNEYRPLATIPVDRMQTVCVFGDQAVSASLMRPESLANVLKTVHGTNVRHASTMARRFIVEHHSWKSARRRILQAMAAINSDFP